MVYIIDPDDSIREGMTLLLDTLNISVLSYPNANIFLTSTIAELPERGCLIVAADLPGLDCLTFLRNLRDKNFKLPVFLLANTNSQNITRLALQAGADDVIAKPLINDRLIYLLRQMPD